MSQRVTGRKHSEESKKKISQNHSDVSGEKNPMWGKTHSRESREKIKKGRKEWNEKVGISDEVRFEMSKKRRGRKNPNYNSTSVLQFDLDGNLIKEWLDLFSLKESGFNSKLISQVCRGFRKKAFGYVWRFKNEENL